MKVNEKINAYLTANGINPATLSNSTGIPQNRLGALLNGKEVLCAGDLKTICLALNVSPETFIHIQGGTGND